MILVFLYPSWVAQALLFTCCDPTLVTGRLESCHCPLSTSIYMHQPCSHRPMPATQSGSMHNASVTLCYIDASMLHCLPITGVEDVRIILTSTLLHLRCGSPCRLDHHLTVRMALLRRPIHRTLVPPVNRRAILVFLQDIQTAHRIPGPAIPALSFLLHIHRRLVSRKNVTI